MASDPFITIHTTPDAIEAEQLGDILRQEGLTVRQLGNDAAIASLYASPMLADFRILVPAPDAEAAQQVVEAFLGGVDPEDQGDLPWELQDDDQDGELTVAGDAQRGLLAYAEQGGELELAEGDATPQVSWWRKLLGRLSG